jgi:YbbR domain-containing protein
MTPPLGSWLSRLRELVFENIGLKILSFGFALLLYAFSHGTQDAQRTLPVDVVATPPPVNARRVLLTPLPPQVRVTVRGPRSLLDEMRAEDLGSLQVDLSNGKLDHIEFEPKHVHVPPGVHVEQIDPPSIELRWEDVVLREVPVQASITGQPSPGFVVKGVPRADPSSVRARGPRSVIDVVQYARAEAFDVTGLQKEGEYQRTVAIDRPPSRVEFETQTATVKVEIAREELQRLFVKIPVQLVGLARGAVTPAEVDVRVEGPPEIVRALRTDQIVPTVDPKAAGANVTTPGSAKLEVKVELEQCKATIQPQIVVVRW